MWISAGVITKRWGRQTVVTKESWHVFCFDVAMIDNNDWHKELLCGQSKYSHCYGVHVFFSSRESKTYWWPTDQNIRPCSPLILSLRRKAFSDLISFEPWAWPSAEIMRFLLVAITLVCADLHFSCLGSKTSGNQVRFYSCYINTYIRQGPIISSSINLFSPPICFEFHSLRRRTNARNVIFLKLSRWY